MGIIDLIFPKSCLGCGKEGEYICPDCVAKVRLSKPICAYCGKASIDGFTHIKCARKFGLEGLFSVWEYEGVIRKAILALKYKYSLEVGKELSDLFIKYIKDSNFLMPGDGVLIPIPIYWYRENKRGFNQSVEIGKLVAEKLNKKFMPDFLIRTRSTRPQVELKGNERRQNLRDVFAVHSQSKAPALALIFDDVFTTGSTLREAAKVLKHAGVERIWGLTIAR